MSQENGMYYKGKRLEASGLRHAFLEIKDGETRNIIYPKAKDKTFYGCVIGEFYRDNEDPSKFPSLWQEYKVDGADHPNALEWQVEHRLAIEQSKVKNKKRAPALDKIVDDLRYETRKLNRAERALFIAFLISQMTGW